MRWKDAIIGFISAVLVTVLGGVGVYYATREKPQATSQERLTFAVDKIAQFKAENTSFTLLTLRLNNSGSATAENIDVGMAFDPDVVIIDKSITLSAGPVGQYSIAKQATNQLTIHTPSLTPGESIAISLMLNKEPVSPPVVGVKSAKSVGEPMAKAVSPAEYSKKKDAQRILGFLLPVLVAVQLGLVAYLRRKLGKYPQNINNTAFLYLHLGLHEAARKLLEREILDRGASSHELSNYALCLELAGDHEKSVQHLAAAQFMAVATHQKAVFYFDKALCQFLCNETTDGLTSMKAALRLSRREILRYCDFSKVVSDIQGKIPQFKQFLDAEKQA